MLTLLREYLEFAIFNHFFTYVTIDISSRMGNSLLECFRGDRSIECIIYIYFLDKIQVIQVSSYSAIDNLYFIESL